MDLAVLAQVVTAAVVSVFGAIKAIMAVVAFFKKSKGV
jgi:hypothetical protein